MKQVLIKKGKAVTEEIPAPTCGDGEILIQVKYSLVSTGTEITSLTESGKSLVKKAKEQPQNIKLLLDMIKKQGLKKTLNLVRGALESGTATGYSAAGIVLEVGKNVIGFKKGDRVAAAGAGKTNHAEIIAVPKNLVVKVPENVDFSDAASVTLGSIALQGVRQADPKLGDKVVVIGLGLIGLLTVQILKASGCHVIGSDLDENRLKMAKNLGADLTVLGEDNTVTKVLQETEDKGADRIIICAATKSDRPINDAMQMVRKKGTVVVVGAVGLNLKRSPFYEKEAELKISCSYGPGRYDQKYEEKGQDYPFGYVRWTENRNMQEYLNLLSDGKINFKKMVERKYLIDKANLAYESLKNSKEKPLAILLKYPDREKPETLIKLKPIKVEKISKKTINVAVIGAGSFATSMHLPNLEKLKKYYKIKAIIDKNGVTAKQVAERYNASHAGTDYSQALKRKDIDIVLIATRHNLHAKIAKEALMAGKAVFSEKPMALNEKELDELVKTIQKTKKPYMVGFNRRFSPYAKKIKELIRDLQNPLMIYYRMNAGYIPLDHWVHNEEGGGRIIGEACHIFDLFNFLTGSEPIEVTYESINPKTNYYSAKDNMVITVKYADGSVCTLLYTALGGEDFGKEYMEVYFDNKTIVLDDYQKMTGFGIAADLTGSEQNKGHLQELIEFAEGIKSGKIPIELKDMKQATYTTFLIEDGLKK